MDTKSPATIEEKAGPSHTPSPTWTYDTAAGDHSTAAQLAGQQVKLEQGTRTDPHAVSPTLFGEIAGTGKSNAAYRLCSNTC